MDNATPEYWHKAFDRLLTLLTGGSYFLSNPHIHGRIKVFEFALYLPDLLKRVQQTSQLPSAISYRIMMKAGIIHSFLHAAEMNMRKSYIEGTHLDETKDLEAMLLLSGL